MAAPALDAFDMTYSATTRHDMRRLARSLDRRSPRGETAEIRLRLAAVLHGHT